MHPKQASSAWKKYQNPVFYTVAILLGLIAGSGHSALLEQSGLFFSELFIRLFKLLSMPLIALSLIVTFCSNPATSGSTPLFRRVLLYTFSTTFVAACIAALLYLWIAPANIEAFNTAPIGDLQNSVQSGLATKSYAQHLLSLVPSNIFAPFLEHQVITVLCLGALIGWAMRAIPDPMARQTVSAFFKGIHSIFIIMTGALVKILPLGLFGFVTTLSLEYREGLSMAGLGDYLTIIVGANLIQGLIVLPLWLLIKKQAPFKIMVAMWPALSLAFFSKSSTATLPLTMEMAEQRLKIPGPTVGFILPLCTTINMNGCAAFIFTTVVYVMQNQGLELGMGSLLLWILGATVAAIGNAGVPMGCFFLSASLLAGMGMPLNLLALILPFYTLIDMIETALNVWSDSCVTVVAHQDSLKQPAP